jgi:hypothetical protein
MDASALTRLREHVETRGIERVLITNLRLKDLSGTELIVVDLARCLAARGCEVHVCATVCAPPIKPILEAAGARCHAIDSDLWLSELPSSFDLVIGHHWVVLAHVLLECETAFRALILASYSLTEPNEVLWLFLDEADRILFNSSANCAAQTSIWPDSYTNKSIVFPNSVPHDWIVPAQEAVPPAELARILIVSNHVPTELLAAAKLLREDGIAVDHIGRPGREELVTREILDRADVVVSIGHTVQKAMARGRSVYVYDHYGGCGWIGEHLREQFDNNFSGLAGGAIKSSEVLRAELRDGFAADTGRIAERLTFVRRRCCLEENLLAVLEGIELGDMRRIDPRDQFAGVRLSRMQISQHLPEHLRFRYVNNALSRPILRRRVTLARADGCSGTLHFKINGLPRLIKEREDVRGLILTGELFDPVDPMTALAFVRDDGVRFEAAHGLNTQGLFAQFDNAPFAGAAGFYAALAVAGGTQSFEIIARRSSDGEWVRVGTIAIEGRP